MPLCCPCFPEKNKYNETNSLRELREELFPPFHSLFTSLSHVPNPEKKLKSQVSLAFMEGITRENLRFS